jgi:hypothetical protein
MRPHETNNDMKGVQHHEISKGEDQVYSGMRAERGRGVWVIILGSVVHLENWVFKPGLYYEAGSQNSN